MDDKSKGHPRGILSTGGTHAGRAVAVSPTRAAAPADPRLLSAVRALLARRNLEFRSGAVRPEPGGDRCPDAQRARRRRNRLPGDRRARVGRRTDDLDDCRESGGRAS
jgi:hypothetical protein